jgi:hypothetical protein
VTGPSRAVGAAASMSRLVLLYDESRKDPRARSAGRTCRARAVLRTYTRPWRVVVEVEDEERDALDEIGWYRLDGSRSHEPDKVLEDVRAGYEVLECVVAALFDHAERLKENLSSAEEKAKNSAEELKRLKARATVDQFRPRVNPGTESLMAAKARAKALLAQAADPSVTEEERHAMAKTAYEVCLKHGLFEEALK